MRTALYIGVVLAAVARLVTVATAHGGGADCHRYNIYHLMNNAKNQEDSYEFVVNTVEWLYRYIHCASQLEAIAHLYFDVPVDQMPPRNSPWWQNGLDALQVTNPADPLMGRKRQASSANDRFLIETIRNITTQTNAGCAQWLIEQFAADARQHFKHRTPHFPDPNSYTIAPPHGSAPPATTPQPTSPPATTPTSTRPPATTQLTSPARTTPAIAAATMGATNAAMTAAAAPTVSTYPQASCYNCSSLDCLIPGNAVNVTCPQGLCMVYMKESDRGRYIIRSCGDPTVCATPNDGSCENVESDRLSWNTECRFCCHGDGCNHPPHIIPESTTRVP